MGRPTKTTPREIAVAHHLFGGDSAVVACRKAGYAPSSIKTRAAKIARSEKVQRALQEIARSIRPGELTELGKGRIKQKLCSTERNSKEMLAYIRTGAEMEGALGNHPNELHLHAHTALPVRVQRLLESRMAEILLEREKENAVDAEVEAGTAETIPESPAQLTAPEPILDEPKLTAEERRNRWLEFQAALPKTRMPDCV